MLIQGKSLLGGGRRVEKNLTMQTMLARKLPSYCISLLDTRITGIYHPSWLILLKINTKILMNLHDLYKLLFSSFTKSCIHNTHTHTRTGDDENKGGRTLTSHEFNV